jgi:hypothetical protein
MQAESLKSSTSPLVPRSNLFALPFALTLPERPPGNMTPLAAVQAQEMDLDHLIGDLFLPSSLDSANATAIALAYAVKSKEVSEAEALIAEHRYQQMLIQSRSYLLHMKKTRAKADKIARDQRRFHSLIHNRISVIDIGSKRRQYSTKGRLRSRADGDL